MTDDERVGCRALIARDCEKWTQRALVDETWTFRAGTYVCEPCLTRAENFLPGAHEHSIEEIDRAVEQIKRKDMDNREASQDEGLEPHLPPVGRNGGE